MSDIFVHSLLWGHNHLSHFFCSPFTFMPLFATTPPSLSLSPPLSLSLPPPLPLVARMLSAAQSNRQTHPQASEGSQSHTHSPSLTWGEFCVFVAELRSMQANASHGSQATASAVYPVQNPSPPAPRLGPVSRVRTCKHEGVPLC